jgi:hypothetical protein
VPKDHMVSQLRSSQSEHSPPSQAQTIFRAQMNASLESTEPYARPHLMQNYTYKIISYIFLLFPSWLLGEYKPFIIWYILYMYKPTIRNESLHEISNDNGVRVVNFATSKNLIAKVQMFPHRNVHKCTRMSPDGNTQNQIDHILIDRRKHSSVLDVRSFRAADCDTDHYLVVAKIRERLAVNKQGSHKFHMQRFNFKKLNEVEGKVRYRAEVSNRFTALQDLDDEVEFNSVSETTRENIKTAVKESLAYYELKKHKPLFYDGCTTR